MPALVVLGVLHSKPCAVPCRRHNDPRKQALIPLKRGTVSMKEGGRNVRILTVIVKKMADGLWVWIPSPQAGSYLTTMAFRGNVKLTGRRYNIFQRWICLEALLRLRPGLRTRA